MTPDGRQTDVFLQPGDLFVGDAACRLRTVLGSCVSITLWHPARRVGAMSHFLLPSRGNAAPAAVLDGRYGDEALRVILQQLQQRGIAPGQCQAKVFGGGNMFPDQTGGETLHVGRRNGDAARQLLREHGIPVVSQSLFGVGHRQIIFDVATGDVWQQQVRPPGHAAEDLRP